jgi:hypothetical protein
MTKIDVKYNSILYIVSDIDDFELMREALIDIGDGCQLYHLEDSFEIDTFIKENSVLPQLLLVGLNRHPYNSWSGDSTKMKREKMKGVVFIPINL